MRTTLILILLLFCAGLAAGPADTLSVLNMPQLANPFFDFFTRNYLGVEAAGRGYTGTSVPGSGQNLFLNPAGMLADSLKAFVEVNIKPPINTRGFGTNSNYSSPVPLAVFGLGFSLSDKIAAGITYSNPKSIILDDFSIEINQGNDLVTRYPTYYLHQVSASLAYHPLPKLHLGLNLHNQLHFLDDVLFLRSYERIRDYKYTLRMQPGVILGDQQLGIGLSATLPTPVKWKLKYADYDTELPLEVSAGAHYAFDVYRLAGDVRYRQDSKISDQFEDHLSLHLGAERRFANNVYRLGYFYSSDVFSGIVKIPLNTTALADTSIFWDDVSQEVPIKDTSQHFLSIGFSHLFRDGSVNLSAMHSFIGEYRQTQVNLSLSLYLSSFKRKDFLYYE